MRECGLPSQRGGKSNGSNRATMIREFEQIPRSAERVIFFPKAAGG